MYTVSRIVDGEILPKMGVINNARWHERGIWMAGTETCYTIKAINDW